MQLKHYFKLHFVVLLYGFTAILGKIITLPATQIVGYRMLIACASLGIYLLCTKRSLRIGLKESLKIMGIGVVVALHWICFFHAVKISNVSVTLGCMAATSLFVSGCLEPLLLRKKINGLELGIATLIIGGLYLIFRFEMHYWGGILIALTAAFLAGLFTVLNKRVIDKNHSVTITFYEMLSGFIVISIYLFFTGDLAHLVPPTTPDLTFIFILGVACTAYAFVVSVEVMRVLSAYSVVLAINLEPVYGILLAYAIWGESEQMSLGFYLGTLIILSAVVLHPLLVKKKST